MVKMLNDVYLDLRNEMRKHSIEGCQIEARELVCFALNLTTEEFFTKKNMLLFEKDLTLIDSLTKRRFNGEPIQHITGKWEFYGLEMDVSRDTLIPRSDTETLAECAIKSLESREKGRILDLCCGSACVGIAILKNVSSGINGVFSDVSDSALRIARKNIMRHALTVRAITIKADARDPFNESGGKFHLIVCNPPYIPTKDIEALDPEVRAEPRLALDGGADGYDFYRAIAKNYRAALVRGGMLMFEAGIGQASEICNIMTQSGFTKLRVENDLSGIERVVIGTLE